MHLGAAHRGRGRQAPVAARHEGIDLALPLDDEEERGRLARPVRDEPQRRQREARARRVAQRAREEAREGDANLQVELLAHVHRARLGAVRLAQVGQRAAHLALRHGRELRAPHALLRVPAAQHLEHFEADVLALSVAVEPQTQPAALGRSQLQVLDHAERRRRLLDHLACSLREDAVEQPAGGAGLKVATEHVAEHARHGDRAAAARWREVRVELVYHERSHAARALLTTGEDVGYRERNRRLLRHHEHASVSRRRRLLLERRRHAGWAIRHHTAKGSPAVASAVRAGFLVGAGST